MTRLREAFSVARGLDNDDVDDMTPWQSRRNYGNGGTGVVFLHEAGL